MKLLAAFSILKDWLLPLAMASMLTLVCLTVPARADSPFDLESSSWMSFDRYKEKPSHWMAPEDRAQAVLQPVVVAPPLPPTAMPLLTNETKLVVPPVMPGFNRGFEVKVNSTEDDNQISDSLLNNANADPNLKDNTDWTDAVAAAKRLAEQKRTGAKEEEPAFTHIRFSALPNIPMPEPKAEKAAVAAKKIEIAKAKEAPPAAAAPKPPSVDPAICAALDAYKKRQLAALESDRKTLDALQNAIAQLGLQKKLDFMTGATGVLETQNTDKSDTGGFTLASPSKN